MVTRLTENLIEEYLGDDISPQVTTEQHRGTIMVPAEYIERILKDIEPNSASTSYGRPSTKKGWIEGIKQAISKSRGSAGTRKKKEGSTFGTDWASEPGWKKLRLLPVELVSFNMDEYWDLQNEIIEILESKQTDEAMKWTKAAAIARFMDKTGLSHDKHDRLTRSFTQATKSVGYGNARKAYYPKPNLTLKKGKDTL